MEFQLRYALVLLTTLTWIASNTCFSAEDKPQQPNVLLIVADDLGYSDLGCYGSEIETPNLDALADSGVRFSQFHTTARCCPSRGCLLTGQYPHRVGLGHMTRDLGLPGYRGRLNPGTPTLANLLQSAGYRTFIAGKWHLGTPDPTQHGFEAFYGTLTSAKTFWEPSHYQQIPVDCEYLKIDKANFFGTDAITSAATQFLDHAHQKSNQPWFLYLAYNAPHFPLQARPETIAKYKDRYLQGWEALGRARSDRQRELGLIPEKTILPVPSQYEDYGARETGINPDWSKLSEERRIDLAHRMAIYAAMVDELDAGVGRVIEHLKQNEDLDKTLIMFVSDNGACAEWDPFGFDVESSNWNRLYQSDELDQMGQRGTFHSVGSAWASASNTPFRLYKHYCHQGGVLSPCLIVPPKSFDVESGAISPEPVHLIDIVPTILEIADVKVEAEFPGASLTPQLTPTFLKGQSSTRPIFLEHEGNRGVRLGDWKLVALRGEDWELYDLKSDPTERSNLCLAHPEIVADLSSKWKKWAKEQQVTPLPEDYGIAYLPGPTLNKILKEQTSAAWKIEAKASIPRLLGPAQKLADGFKFTEGPAWDPLKSVLYFSDIPNRTLHRLNIPGRAGPDLVELRRGETASNGIALDGQGGLMFCDVAGCRIVHRSAEGVETVITESASGQRIGMPNDIWRHPNGSYYFTIPKLNARRAKIAPPGSVNGVLCRISPDLKSTEVTSAELISPNGVCGTPDGGYLYVTDAGKCWRYQVLSETELSHAILAAPKSSDGLAVDKVGNLYTTGEKGIVVFNPIAQQITMLPVPEKPSNLFFADPSCRTLFVTARTSVYQLEMMHFEKK